MRHQCRPNGQTLAAAKSCRLPRARESRRVTQCHRQGAHSLAGCPTKKRQATSSFRGTPCFFMLLLPSLNWCLSLGLGRLLGPASWSLPKQSRLKAYKPCSSKKQPRHVGTTKRLPDGSATAQLASCHYWERWCQTGG